MARSFAGGSPLSDREVDGAACGGDGVVAVERAAAIDAVFAVPTGLVMMVLLLQVSLVTGAFPTVDSIGRFYAVVLGSPLGGALVLV